MYARVCERKNRFARIYDAIFGLFCLKKELVRSKNLILLRRAHGLLMASFISS